MIPILRTQPMDDASAHLAALKQLPLTYWERGATDWLRMPQGYNHDELRVPIGRGKSDFLAAKQAIRDWRMFPPAWTSVDRTPKIKVGTQVLVNAKVLGLWWCNPARVVYVLDQPKRFGFAYGTLPGHLAQGEECFSVELAEDGVVYYHLRVMSRPMWWVAKLVSGFARRQQARFREDSAVAMRLAVAESQDRIAPLVPLVAA